LPTSSSAALLFFLAELGSIGRPIHCSIFVPWRLGRWTVTDLQVFAQIRPMGVNGATDGLRTAARLQYGGPAARQIKRCRSVFQSRHASWRTSPPRSSAVSSSPSSGSLPGLIASVVRQWSSEQIWAHRRAKASSALPRRSTSSSEFDSCPHRVKPFVAPALSRCGTVSSGDWGPGLRYLYGQQHTPAKTRPIGPLL